MNRPIRSTVVRVVSRMTDNDIEKLFNSAVGHPSNGPYFGEISNRERDVTRSLIRAVEDRFASSESHPLPPGKYDAVVTFTSPDTGVLQAWMLDLTLKMQTVILASLRGPDRNSPLVKRYTKFIRGLALRDADGQTDFLARGAVAYLPTLTSATFSNTLKGFEAQPIHFVMHLIHALEIVAYRHPEETVRGVALDHYTAICRAFHLNVETPEQLEVRLVDAEED